MSDSSPQSEPSLPVETPAGFRHVSTGSTRTQPNRRSKMAKGLNQKKTEKKKPEKTLKEKRAEKAAKKGK
jgi:hypothetical protein